MGNRPNQRLWHKWANESGAAFDWLPMPRQISFTTSLLS